MHEELLFYFAARTQDTLIRHHIQKSGFNKMEYLVMYFISVHPGLTMQSIQKRSTFDKAQISRTIKTLEQSGMIYREPINKKSYALQFTEQGKEAFASLDAQMLTLHNQMWSVFTPEEKATFLELLAKLYEVFDNYMLENEMTDIHTYLQDWKQEMLVAKVEKQQIK
ncbi:MAG: MarR family winged helix-turn-helix transcriptional regulator [Culicoidibacterales bacterium]